MKNMIAMAWCFACVLGVAQGYRIEHSDKPTPVETTAVQELRDYLAKRINGTLSVDGHSHVTFAVGDTALAKDKHLASTDLAEEQWVIKSFGDKVLLNGGGRRGVLYAVYHFLEDFCDIHWWSDLEEYVPPASELALPTLDKRGCPAFLYRDIFRDLAEHLPVGPRTAVRNRLNRNGDQPIPAELGGEFGYGSPYNVHTFNLYVPVSKYMDPHPEYFSLVKGKRIGGVETGQLCLSNPGVKALFREKLLEFIRKDRDRAVKAGLPAPRLYDISMNDNSNFCSCPGCLKEAEQYGRGGEYLRFVNGLAEEVGRLYPELFLTTLAYLGTETPPKAGVRAASNLIVRLCDTTTSQALSIYAPRNKEFRSKVEAWKNVAEHLFIWEYAAIYGKGMNSLPYPSEMTYGELLKFYHENHVKGIFWEHEHPSHGDMYELKYFLECKLMEDPYQDSQTLIQLFLDRYYGVAAPFVLQYRQRLDQAAREKNANIPWTPSLNGFFFISDELCQECQELLDMAEAAVKGDAQLHRRVRHLRAGLDILTCTRGITRHGAAFAGKRMLDSAGAARRLQESYVEWFRQYNQLPKLAEDAEKFISNVARSRWQGPPPEHLQGRSYYEYTAFDFAIKGPGMAVVHDPESVTGLALMSEADLDKNYRLPFVFGFHDKGGGRTLLTERVEHLPEQPGYHWYKVGKTVIPAEGYIFVTGAWTTQIFPQVPALVGQQVEIWISVKHSGPLFRSDQNSPSRIYVDRAIIVLD